MQLCVIAISQNTQSRHKVTQKEIDNIYSNDIQLFIIQIYTHQTFHVNNYNIKCKWLNLRLEKRHFFLCKFQLSS